jgi:hypothetical protein
MSEQRQQQAAGFERHEPEFETQDEIEEKRRIRAIFDEMEGKQLDFLDESGKSLIERVATFLAVLFAVTAFGGNFPPAYMKNNAWNKAYVIAILACYLVAMFLALLAIQPFNRPRHRYETKKMAQTLQSMITRKKWLVQIAGILFALGTVVLALLIFSIILPV